MSISTNKQRLTNLLKGIQKSIDLFEAQGHTNVYFNAQFFKGGRKQNGIERGDVASFSKQIRTYVFSEEAESAKIDFIDESTGKSIYAKVLSDLGNGKTIEPAAGPHGGTTDNGQSQFNGLGEAAVNNLIDKRVNEERRNDEFQRLNIEVEELRTRNTTLQAEKEELEATVNAKKELEFYTGIIGAAFPGLAPLFNGTPLAQAAGFLAGTSDLNGNAISAKEPSEEASSISSLVSEFCSTLNTQEAGTMHLLFMTFEKDRSQIQRALQLLTTTAPATT